MTSTHFQGFQARWPGLWCQLPQRHQTGFKQRHHKHKQQGELKGNAACLGTSWNSILTCLCIIIHGSQASVGKWLLPNGEIWSLYEKVKNCCTLINGVVQISKFCHRLPLPKNLQSHTRVRKMYFAIADKVREGLAQSDWQCRSLGSKDYSWKCGAYLERPILTFHRVPGSHQRWLVPLHTTSYPL